MKEKLDLGKN